MSDLSISLTALERNRTQLSARTYFDEGVFSDERALVFALGRRVRFSLAAPSVIRERLDQPLLHPQHPRHQRRLPRVDGQLRPARRRQPDEGHQPGLRHRQAGGDRRLDDRAVAERVVRALPAGPEPAHPHLPDGRADRKDEPGRCLPGEPATALLQLGRGRHRCDRHSGRAVQPARRVHRVWT